jgi:phage terminase large subunit-like protein
MSPLLRLVEDVISNTANDVRLAPAPRMIFVTHGAVTIAGRTIAIGEAWSGEQAITLTPAKEGACCWRWELVKDDSGGLLTASGTSSRPKLSAQLDTIPAGELLLRGDSVAFPPGGCAYRHVHQGPGIRCMTEGGIRIDTSGHSTSYGPGGAWFESGPEPVFAQGATDRPSRFIRVMILPRTLIGKSSIRYVDEADKDKPRMQQYQIFADMPINGTFG